MQEQPPHGWYNHSEQVVQGILMKGCNVCASTGTERWAGDMDWNNLAKRCFD